ncbi:hypothetical protein GGI21_002620 [Coemansia aciculifera]|nr:hypothetical protein GGI21_002620 [Coemansia aciculifera]
MADTDNTSAASETTNQQQPARKRFQKKQLSAEYLQEDYEQNMLGVTAGFFCAIWAAWVMGEHFSSMFTTFDYPDLDNDGHYYFGGKDVALVVFVASKILFVRAALFRYVLRPTLRCLGVQSFERRQRLAELVFASLVYSVSALSGAYFVGQMPQISSIGLEYLWSSACSSVGISTEFKVFVLGQCAMRLAELVAEFIEGEDKPGYYRRIAIHYLFIGTLSCAGLLGREKFAGLVVLAVDFPAVAVADAALLSDTLLASIKPALGFVAGSVAAASTLVVLPSLAYASAWCETPANVSFGSGYGWTLVGSMATLCALQAIQAAKLWRDSPPPVLSQDMAKKTL